MPSNLITPPDILNNGLHSVVLIDPDQDVVDAVIRLCQHNDREYNIYVYTPNMENVEWLTTAVNSCDVAIINTRSDDYKDLWLLNKTYYYGSKILIENPRKLTDPIHYFAQES
jgi:hypothetical protein